MSKKISQNKQFSATSRKRLKSLLVETSKQDNFLKNNNKLENSDLKKKAKRKSSFKMNNSNQSSMMKIKKIFERKPSIQISSKTNNLNCIKNNIYQKNSIFSNNFQNPLIFPTELKEKYRDSFENHVNSYKTIFGNENEVFLNYKQLKILFNQLGIVDKVNDNFNFDNQKDENICKLFFDILGTDKIYFDLLKAFLVLFHQLKAQNTHFKLFNSEKKKLEIQNLKKTIFFQKKNSIKNNEIYPIPIVFNKNENQIKKKNNFEIDLNSSIKKLTDKEKIHKEENFEFKKKLISRPFYNSDENSSNKELLTQNKFNQRDSKEKKYETVSKNNLLIKKNIPEEKDKVLFFAQVNFSNKSEKIYIRENDNIKDVALDFKKKNGLTEDHYQKILKMLLNKKQILHK